MITWPKDEKLLIEGRSLSEHYIVGEKTHDVFIEVTFLYDTCVWYGAVPKYLEKQGVDFSDQELIAIINEWHLQLHPMHRGNWIKLSDQRWEDRTTATYKVLQALYSGEWQCRKCGPVPQVNPQSAARLRDLKKRGYVLCSKRKLCADCGSKQMHDILVMVDASVSASASARRELRKTISQPMVDRIKTLLENIEVCFGVKRNSWELVIDHKFPSQRWSNPESGNSSSMSDSEIRAKFQLLSNQTNMMKSRICDNCVDTGVRGSFFGVTWFYSGSAQWTGISKDDENGCLGCPWYDLVEWKSKLTEKLTQQNR